MKGLDLSRTYFHEIINPIIRKSTSPIGNNYAAALIGWGSDVLGNDDYLSRDHEWGPRCIIFLPNYLQQYSKDLYNELNSKIPCKYKNYSTRFVFDHGTFVPSKDKSGNVHIEITTCNNYFKDLLGIITPTSDIEWLSIPENRLLEITSGEVFFDGIGELTKIRQFYKLPNLSKEVGSVIEECYVERDVKKTIKQLNQIIELLIEYQNNIVGFPEVKMQKSKFSRDYFDPDLQFIADQIHATINGELKELSLDGAIDQWITNEDFLLESNRMKSLSIIYNK